MNKKIKKEKQLIEENYNLDRLISNIVNIDNSLRNKATSAINSLLTLRNWLTGYYIVEYEQNGSDKAKYGTKILQEIAENLKSKNIKNMNIRELRRLRLFYQIYSDFISLFSGINSAQISNSSPVLGNEQIRGLLPFFWESSGIRGVASPELEKEKIYAKSLEFEAERIRGMASPELTKEDNSIAPEVLISNLSYSHFLKQN